MIAYHNDPKIKNDILQVLQSHYDADEFVKGHYWQNGKGCAVGCTVHCGDHSLYESHFGIPEALAHLEDCIFEGLPNRHAKEWPLQFMSAIPVGADLSRVQWQFLYWLMTTKEANPGIDHPIVSKAVAGCAELMRILADEKNKWSAMSAMSAESAAESAAWSAESAAESAAWSAESAVEAARAAAEAARAKYDYFGYELLKILRGLESR